MPATLSAWSNPAGTSSLPEAAELGNASDDIHYESIGKRSLKAGDSLSVDVAAAQAAYEREIVWIGGHDYQRTSVKGHLTVKNFRARELTLVIIRRFSGELLEAEENPGKSLNTEGIASVNPRRQFDWTLKLPAGGEQSLNYRYQVLVRR